MIALRGTIALFFLLIFSSLYPLTLEQKVAQLLVIHLKGKELSEESRAFLQEVPVGGVILYSWANGLESTEQTAKLVQQIKHCYHQQGLPPPFFMIDQEGGRVMHLGSSQPSASEVGALEDPQFATQTAGELARPLVASGINVVLAPVVDVADPSQYAFQSRSFSSSPSQVRFFASKYLEAFSRKGLLACLKHFPGHGSAKGDSHLKLPIVTRSAQEIWREDLLPFRELHAQVPFIMTAHLLVPAFDDQPVTFSEKVVQGILREKVGFQGVILSDSLAMEGICAGRSPEEVAWQTLCAGHDLLLLGGKQLLSSQDGFEYTLDDVRHIHRYLVHKSQEDKERQQAINQSLKRINQLK